MHDFSTSTETVGVPVNTQWRTGKHGQDGARPGQIDASKFTAGTHYNIGGRTDGIIPSGVALGLITATKKYGPYDPAATDGREVLDSYLNNDEGVPLSANATIARLRHGVIKPSALPVVAQRTSVLTAETTGQFIHEEN